MPDLPTYTKYDNLHYQVTKLQRDLDRAEKLLDDYKEAIDSTFHKLKQHNYFLSVQDAYECSGVTNGVHTFRQHFIRRYYKDYVNGKGRWVLKTDHNTPILK